MKPLIQPTTMKKPKLPEPRKLNPPHFDEQLIDFTRKHIALSQSVIRAKSGRFV